MTTETMQPEVIGRSWSTGAGGAPDIRSNSICVIIKTSRFTTRRAVSKAVVTVEADTGRDSPKDNIDQDMVVVAKDLLDSPELRRIATFDNVTKLWVKARSVPSPLLRSSAYMLSVGALEEMYDYLVTRKAERAPLEEAFAAAYPALIALAKIRLGPLFDPTEYPPVEVVRREFSFAWMVVEISTPDAKLRGVSQSLFEKEKRKAELVWTNAVGQVREALAEGMAEVVKHLSDRLGAGDEPPKRFRESAIKRVTDFLDTFAQRNLAGDADLAKLVGDARRLLSGVDAKELKKETGTRKRVAEGFSAIRASLDTMLEDRPLRAEAIADDEV